MAEVIDLTNLPTKPRSTESRWSVKERLSTKTIKVDPLLVFRPTRIVKNDNFRITKVADLQRIPPLNHVTSLRSKLLENQDNAVVWDGYGVFDWTALNELSKVHEDRQVVQQVNEESQWLKQFSETQTTDIQQYMYNLWHSSSTCAGRETLLCHRLVSDDIIEEVLKICNSKSESLHLGDVFLLLNNRNKISLDKGTRTVHFVLNVTKKDGRVFVTPSNEGGTHWSYLLLNVHKQHAVYIDSLGWNIPVNLKEEVANIFNNDSILTNLHITSAHENRNNSRSHVCTDKCEPYAPLQTCSSVCGVSVLSICLLRFQGTLWDQFRSSNGENTESRILKAIKEPTNSAHRLRLMIMICIGKQSTQMNSLELIPSNVAISQNRTSLRTKTRVNFQDIFMSILKKQNVRKRKAAETATAENSTKLRLNNLTESTSNTQELFEKSKLKTNNESAFTTHSITQEKNDLEGKKNIFIDDEGNTKNNVKTTGAEKSSCENKESQPKEVEHEFVWKSDLADRKYILDENSTTPCNISDSQESLDGQDKHENTAFSKLDKDNTSKTFQENIGQFEKKMINNLIRIRKKNKDNKAARKTKIQTNIKTVFQKLQEKTHTTEQKPKQKAEIFKDFQNCVYSTAATFKGISKKFYMSIGRNANKNMQRDKARADNPIKEECGKKVGLARFNDQSRTLSDLMNDTSYANKVIRETVKYLNNNGPIVKTQRICDYYQSLKQSSKRIMSSEIVEKLGRHAKIKQIYVNGTGYLINGHYADIIPIVTELEEMCKIHEQQDYNITIRNRIENNYANLLKTLKDPFDRQLIKGFMATITTPELMTKIEGKQNKMSHTHCRDSLRFSLKKYKNLEQISLTVRNDMTNNQQRSFSKRLLEKKKKEELKTVFAGRGRLLKSEQFPELASVLEMCFGELSVLVGGSGLESHPRLSDGVLYRACDSNMHMKKAREIIMQLAPETFEISLSSCYNYTENYRAGSHQSKQHHAGRNVNANISLKAPPRTGVEQFVVNLHWTTSNVNLYLDHAETHKDSTFTDSKDSKSVVCANVAPVQKVGKSWSRREYLDHDWNQSRTFAVTPMTHLILNTERTLEVTGSSSVFKVKRTGQAITLVNISHFEPETAFRMLNDLLLIMINPETSEFFRSSVTGELKKNFMFVVDNGPSTSPNNTIVKMCLVRLFKLLDLDSICQVSYAEYHSKRNPVERVHAEENRALSRHGPFTVETKLVKVGSEEHKSEMEKMLHEVADCLRTGQFNKKSLIALRGVTEETGVFKDEEQLKRFISMSREQKDLCEETYMMSDTGTTEQLDIVWKINTNFKGSYIDDYQDIETNEICNKYTFRFLKEHSNTDSIQPIPDFMKYMKTEELHYLGYKSNLKFLQFCHVPALCKDSSLYLPSRILDICWTLDRDPPSDILVLISILSWVPTEHVLQYFSQKNSEQKALMEKDKDVINWRHHDMYRKTKAELQKQCRLMSINCDGTKIELIKRICQETKDIQNNKCNLEMNDIPNSLSGIASMHVAAIRTILANNGLSAFGSKEELVLRLFMLKHQPDVVFKTERDALLDIVTVTETIIQNQCQLDLASVSSERMFLSNTYTTTRKQTLNTDRLAPKVPHPAHLTCDTLQNLFQPMKEYFSTHGKKERQKTRSFRCMTAIGSTVKVKWQKEEVEGTGWSPGWYSAVVTNYSEETDDLEVEYLQEQGFKYNMNYTEMLSKGFLEPTKHILAKLESYEKVTTVGQEIQIKLENESDWQDAEVIAAVEDDDTIHVKLLSSPHTLHVVEVSPAVDKSLRLKRRTPVDA